jgi:hypothetical protein
MVQPYKGTVAKYTFKLYHVTYTTQSAFVYAVSNCLRIQKDL